MSDKLQASVLFLGKADDQHCLAALRFLRKNFEDVRPHLGKWGDALPEDAKYWQGDYIISYLSRWVVPESLIRSAKIAAINFHPASPAYPGIGCNNFALYDGAEEYGVTCHFMGAQVDTGQIIATKKFPLLSTDDVASLLERTYAYQLVLFYEIVSAIAKGMSLSVSGETWERPPFSRKQFNKLATITPDMSPEEIARRVRATTFGQWRPTVRIGDHVFEYRPTEG
jgi:methionyl-tRNA formyltransferase